MAMTGNVKAKYESLGGANGLLGRPVGDEERYPSDRAFLQLFEHGAIYWPLLFTDAGLSLDCYELHGAIYAAWSALPQDVSTT